MSESTPVAFQRPNREWFEWLRCELRAEFKGLRSKVENCDEPMERVVLQNMAMSVQGFEMELEHWQQQFEARGAFGPKEESNVGLS